MRWPSPASTPTWAQWSASAASMHAPRASLKLPTPGGRSCPNSSRWKLAPRPDDREFAAMTRPLVLGVTGNIGCGKSTVLAMLAERGAATLDADAVYHELIDPNMP